MLGSPVERLAGWVGWLDWVVGLGLGLGWGVDSPDLV